MSTRGHNLIERNRRLREDSEQKVMAALLAASPGGLTISELMAITGLSEGGMRKRIQALRGERRARVCDFRELPNVTVEAWGLGSAPSMTLKEWMAKRAETDAEQAMCEDILRNHACWMKKWTARRDAAAAWL